MLETTYLDSVQINHALKNLLNRADNDTDTVTKVTIDTELSGIKMAETTGDKLPVMAKLSPTTL